MQNIRIKFFFLCSEDLAVDFINFWEFSPVFRANSPCKGIKYKSSIYISRSGKVALSMQRSYNIDRRCTRPFTPKKNGMVEKANKIIKKGTIKRTKYDSLEEMNINLMNFLVHYGTVVLEEN